MSTKPAVSTSSTALTPRYLGTRTIPSHPAISTSSAPTTARAIYRPILALLSSSNLRLNPHYAYRSIPSILSGTLTSANYETGKYRPLPNPLSTSVLSLIPRYLYRSDPVIQSLGILSTNLEILNNIYILDLPISATSSIALIPRYLYRSNPLNLSTSQSGMTVEALYEPIIFPSSNSILSQSTRYAYRTTPVTAVSISSSPYITDVVVISLSSGSLSVHPEYVYRSSAINISSANLLSALSRYRYRVGLAQMSSVTGASANVEAPNTIYNPLANAISASLISVIVRYLYRSRSATSSIGSLGTFDRVLYRSNPVSNSSSSSLEIPIYVYRADPVIMESSGAIVSTAQTGYRSVPHSSSSAFLNVFARYLYRSNPVSIDNSIVSLIDRLLLRPDPVILVASSSVTQTTHGAGYRSFPSATSQALMTIVIRYLFRPDAIMASIGAISATERNIFRSNSASVSFSSDQITDRYLLRLIENILSQSKSSTNEELFYRPDPSIVSSGLSGIFPSNYRSYPSAHSLSSIGINVEYINAAVLTGGNKGPERIVILSGGAPVVITID